MLAAIHARQSTEQTGAADEAKSVARQVDHARASLLAGAADTNGVVSPTGHVRWWQGR